LKATRAAGAHGAAGAAAAVDRIVGTMELRLTPEAAALLPSRARNRASGAVPSAEDATSAEAAIERHPDVRAAVKGALRWMKKTAVLRRAAAGGAAAAGRKRPRQQLPSSSDAPVALGPRVLLPSDRGDDVERAPRLGVVQAAPGLALSLDPLAADGGKLSAAPAQSRERLTTSAAAVAAPDSTGGAISPLSELPRRAHRSLANATRVHGRGAGRGRGLDFRGEPRFEEMHPSWQAVRRASRRQSKAVTRALRGSSSGEGDGDGGKAAGVGSEGPGTVSGASHLTFRA
jgi:hypothetical protein